MRIMRSFRPLVACAIVAFMALASPARGTAVEHDLPAGLTAPTALAFAPYTRDLWVALDGPWALARVNTTTDAVDLAPLAAPKASANDSLWALRFAPDGALWTGSEDRLHRVDPATLNATSWKLPRKTLLTGDIYVAPTGIVWYATVALDVIVRLDPKTGEVREIEPPARPFGPLSFVDAGSEGAYLSATYADTYARLDPETREITPGPDAILNAPVGIDRARDGTLWFGEMGGSTVARVDPATGEIERFPTTPSPYYPVSGPSGILVSRDGSVWFAEHFADRVARLDPVARTLEEYEVPSAPGTNVQRLAEAPDGTIWFAEFSANKLGTATSSAAPSFTLGEARTSIPQGGSARIVVALPENVVFGVGESRLVARQEAGAILIDASKAEPGAHELLVSVREGKTTVGRYLTIQVEGTTDTPGPMALAVVLAVLTASLVLAGGRRRE